MEPDMIIFLSHRRNLQLYITAFLNMSDETDKTFWPLVNCCTHNIDS